MLPIALDRDVLAGLPLPGEAAIHRALALLGVIVDRRVLPYFRRHRMTDAVRLAQIGERAALARLEDPLARIEVVSAAAGGLQGWTIHVHERLFDLLAFLIPSDPTIRLADAGEEQRRALAFAELLLRHEVEHVLYPGREEAEVLASDLRFALDRRESDPTYCRSLREALESTDNGIVADRYLELIDHGESGGDPAPLIRELADDIAARAITLPPAVLRSAAQLMGPASLASTCARAFDSRATASLPVLARAHRIEAVRMVLSDLVRRTPDTAGTVLEQLAGEVGVDRLARELELELVSPPGEEPPPVTLLADALRTAPQPPATGPAQAPPVQRAGGGPKSLKERIEEARSDPRFPPEAIQIIDRHRGSLTGVSGAKFSELVETILSIPWGLIRPIERTPEEFARGLDASHYGLERPKRLITDFFTNLIWRYRKFSPERAAEWHHSGSAFLFVGPPGVGKTSLAISIARNLGLPYHKVSLGGMRDESDLRGHGFTYEGSKPGAILQGLIRMGIMNGVFILDEADKTEAFAVSTLLEILDPEQNHLFHDKYITTSVDIDLSNCHFILTANTLETVPPPVLDRCEVIHLDRYSVEEKVAIAETYLLPRLRERYDIAADQIAFPEEEREELLRKIVTSYTREAGVRQLERVLRTLLLRLHRDEVLAGRGPVRLTHDVIKRTLDEPEPPRHVPDEDRVGEVAALGVNVERGIGSLIPIQATSIPGVEGEGRGPLSVVHATGNIQKVMDESRTVALTAILQHADTLGLDLALLGRPIHLHFLGASTPKDGPSAGSAIALVLASLLSGTPIRRDLAITGEIDTRGRITGIGGLDIKLESAAEAGCRTVLIPEDNLHGESGIERFPEALRRELQVLTFEQWRGEHEPLDPRRHTLQVVAVRHILQAAEVAFVRRAEIEAAVEEAASHGRRAALEVAASPVPACRQLVYVKHAEDLHPEFLEGPLCDRCSGCRLLALPPAAAELEDRPHAERIASRTVALAGREDLERVLGEIQAACEERHAVTLVGPFFWLRQLGPIEGVRPVACNFTAQGLKLKDLKPLLTRAACYLTRLSPGTFSSCPFVSELDGVVVADLGFIPEKYRLDPRRAAHILSRAVERWIEEVESACRGETSGAR